MYREGAFLHNKKASLLMKARFRLFKEMHEIHL